MTLTRDQHANPVAVEWFRPAAPSEGAGSRVEPLDGGGRPRRLRAGGLAGDASELVCGVLVLVGLVGVVGSALVGEVFLCVAAVVATGAVGARLGASRARSRFHRPRQATD